MSAAARARCCASSGACDESSDAGALSRSERGDAMNPVALAWGGAFFVGALLIAVGIVGPPQRRPSAQSAGETLRDLLPTLKEGDEQNLRLAGITPESYAVQRFGGRGGRPWGWAALISVVWGRGPVGTVAGGRCWWVLSVGCCR